MNAVDDFLIDRIFQPIADALARWASCYAIAAFLLTGFMLSETVVGILFDTWIIWSLYAIGILQILIECYTLQRKALCDVAPQNRIKFGILRSFLLFMVMFSVPLTVVASNSMKLYGLCMQNHWLLVVGLYFMACHMIPPRRQRQTAPHWAAASEHA